MLVGAAAPGKTGSNSNSNGKINGVEKTAAQNSRTPLADVLLIEGVGSFIQQIRNSRIAVVTACNRAAAEFLLQATGLDDYVSVLIAAEDCEKHKPHPEGYIKAMAELGVNEDRCVIFEDSSSGLLAANHACPWKVCFYAGAEGVCPQEVLDEANFQEVDVIFERYAELDLSKLCVPLLTEAPPSRRTVLFIHTAPIWESVCDFPISPRNAVLDRTSISPSTQQE